MNRFAVSVLLAGLLFAVSSSSKAVNLAFKDLKENKLVSYYGNGCHFYTGIPGEESKQQEKVNAKVWVTGIENEDVKGKFDIDLSINPTNGDPDTLILANFSNDRENKQEDTLVEKHCEVRIRLIAKNDSLFKIVDVPSVSLNYELTRFEDGSNSRNVLPALAYSLEVVGGVKKSHTKFTKLDEGLSVPIAFSLSPFESDCVNTLDLVTSFRLLLRGNPEDPNTEIAIHRMPALSGIVKPCG